MYCVGIFLTELSHQVRVELERQGYYTNIDEIIYAAALFPALSQYRGLVRVIDIPLNRAPPITLQI